MTSPPPKKCYYSTSSVFSADIEPPAACSFLWYISKTALTVSPPWAAPGWCEEKQSLLFHGALILKNAHVGVMASFSLTIPARASGRVILPPNTCLMVRAPALLWGFCIPLCFPISVEEGHNHYSDGPFLCWIITFQPVNFSWPL